MLKNILEFFNRFLSYILLVSFIIFIFTQYKIFVLRTSLKEIDVKISDIKNTNAILDVEIAYLTNPERLIKIYKNVYDTDYDNSLLTVKQTKNMTDLLLYNKNKGSGK